MKKMISDQIAFNQILELERYSNGQLAVFVQDYHGEPLAELSVTSDSVNLAPEEFILKDYSENRKLAKVLMESELISITDRYVLIGSHLCPICHFTSEF